MFIFEHAEVEKTLFDIFNDFSFETNDKSHFSLIVQTLQDNNSFSYLSKSFDNFDMLYLYGKEGQYNSHIVFKVENKLYPLNAVLCLEIDFVCDEIYKRIYGVKQSPYINKNELKETLERSSVYQNKEKFFKSALFNFKRIHTDFISLFNHLFENNLIKNEYLNFSSMCTHISHPIHAEKNKYGIDLYYHNKEKTLESLEMFNMLNDFDIKPLVKLFSKDMLTKKNQYTNK